MLLDDIVDTILSTWNQTSTHVQIYDFIKYIIRYNLSIWSILLKELNNPLILFWIWYMMTWFIWEIKPRFMLCNNVNLDVYY